MLDNLEDKIIKTIKEARLSPKPRWHFLLKNKFIWALGIFSLIIGSASVSVVLYLLNNNNLSLHRVAGESFFAWLLLSLPYFWLLFLFLFIWLLYYNIKHTNKGYRYHPAIIATLAILMSIFLGSIFYSLGLGKKIDSVLGEKAPFYDVMFNPHIEMWSRPYQGRLSGLVLSFDGDASFTISDRDKVEWRVLHGNKESGTIILGQVVRLMGYVSGDYEFTAEKVMSMRPGRDFFLRQRPDMKPSPNCPRNMRESISCPSLSQ
jgi:hypothetical protein